MLFTLVTLLCAFLTLLPVAMFLKNTRLFQPACSPGVVAAAGSATVSVCIPARNEEKSIGKALEALTRSTHEHYEILVLDDHSEDKTGEIVRQWQANDDRIKLLSSAPLPIGWNGKQHACWQLASQANHDWLLFLDADVRLSSDALTRCVAEAIHRNVPLVSGFPRQETGTLAEKILIPMMHYVLLCYLPIDQMRLSNSSGFAAGCGQLFLARREPYMQVGGHQSIAGSRHDGIQLPKIFRKNGFLTDIFDATDIATCRMYESWGQVQRGLLKNATEGIANTRLIVPFTILLLGGTWLPLFLFWIACLYWPLWCILLFGILSVASWIPRWIAIARFKQSVAGAFLHPIAILWFVGLQWFALLQHCLGVKTSWRGRI